MKLFIKNLIKLINIYNSGKKICYCDYNLFFLNILGFLIKNNIIKKYYILKINKIKYIVVFIKKIYFFKFYTNSNSLNLKNKILKKKFKYLGLVLINTSLGLLNISECIKLEIGGKPLLIVL